MVEGLYILKLTVIPGKERLIAHSLKMTQSSRYGVKSKMCCKSSPVIDVFSLPRQRYCYSLSPRFEQPPIR